MKVVNRAMERSSCIITICEPMAKAYASLFSKPVHVLYTSAEQETEQLENHGQRLAYFGSLGLERDDQLIFIGKKFMSITGRTIDVYSSEMRPEILKKLVPQNGIEFHHSVSAEEMKQIYKSCMGVIHTESFDNNISSRTRFSISTKIAESLASGPCLFAFGPKGIASIDYLIDTNSAIVVTDPRQLEEGLRLLFNRENRCKVINNARITAQNNHNSLINGQKLRQWFSLAIDSFID